MVVVGADGGERRQRHHAVELGQGLVEPHGQGGSPARDRLVEQRLARLAVRTGVHAGTVRLPRDVEVTHGVLRSALDLVDGELPRDAVLHVGAGDGPAVLPQHAAAQGEGPRPAAVRRGAGVAGEVGGQRPLLRGGRAGGERGQRPAEQAVGGRHVRRGVDALRVPRGHRPRVEHVQRPPRWAGPVDRTPSPCPPPELHAARPSIAATAPAVTTVTPQHVDPLVAVCH